MKVRIKWDRVSSQTVLEFLTGKYILKSSIDLPCFPFSKPKNITITSHLYKLQCNWLDKNALPLSLVPCTNQAFVSHHQHQHKYESPKIIQLNGIPQKHAELALTIIESYKICKYHTRRCRHFQYLNDQLKLTGKRAGFLSRGNKYALVNAGRSYGAYGCISTKWNFIFQMKTTQAK